MKITRRLKLQKALRRWHQRLPLLRTLPLPLLLTAICLLFTAAGTYAGLGGITIGSDDVNLQRSLIGHWKMDGDAQDSTPYNNHGTLNGGMAPVNDRYSNANGALEFDGVDDYVIVGEAGNPNKFAFSFWINPYELDIGPDNEWRHVITTDQTSNFILIEQGGQISIRVPGVNVTWNGAASISAPLNSWTHVAISYNQADVVTYINGVEAKRTAIGPGAPNFGNMGFTKLDGVHTFKGALDDVRFYGRDITTAEVAALKELHEPPSNVQTSDLQKGLVGHWKMDGDGKDATPNSNHGTANGNTAFTGNDRHGEANKTGTFDGTGDYVQMTNSMSLSQNSFTATAWFKTSSTGDNKIISTGISHHQLQVMNGFLRICVNGCTAGNTPIANNMWHFAVVVGDGTSIRAYLNGSSTPVITQVASSTVMTGIPRIGAVGADGGATSATLFFNGQLDDVRLYNRALTVNEIQQLYDSYNPIVSISDLSKGLVGHWSFNGDAKDKTPYTNHGTVTGATLAPDRMNKANSAYSFNGTNDYISVGPDSTLATAQDVTFSAWLFPTRGNYSTDWQVIAGDCWTKYLFGGILPGSMNIGFYAQNPSNAQLSSGTYTLPALNRWYHIVGVASASNGYMRLYVDGVLRSQVNSSFTLKTTGGSHTIGSLCETGNTDRMQGSIDDFRAWNRALSEQEVLRLYETY